MPKALTLPKVVTTVAVAAMVALSVVSCSAQADASCEATPSGPHSSSIKVTGDFGKEPTVTMPDAFEVKTTERSVLISGDGPVALDGDLVTAGYSAFNAATGKPVRLDEKSTWTEASFTVDSTMENSLVGLYKTLKCSRQGDRVVSAIPANELFGAMGVDMTPLGIGPSDTLVFIFDISKVAPAPSQTPAPEPQPQSLPTPVPWDIDVPTVDLSSEEPVVTLPQTTPPAELQLKVITEGTGALVADDNATVSVDYQGTSWDTGKIFDQSFGKGTPATFKVGQVIEGFAAAMIGQKVGATVLVTIPPKYAYGEGVINDQNLQGQTLVFLIQIHDVK